MKTRLLQLAVLLGLSAVAAAADGDKGFVAHEWGTFTCVQGADGVQMNWNPLVVAELPKFVYDRARVRSNGTGTRARVFGVEVAGKTGTVCRQRMETPVIYFYSDRQRTVDVTVNFPEGRITEWYPSESAADPRTPATLHWKDLQVLSTFTCGLPLRTDGTGSHYYAARETDSSQIRAAPNDLIESEKFLFYRGVGSFQAPLTVKLESTDFGRVSLKNSGSEALPDLFLIEVRADGSVAWTGLQKLAAGETQSVTLDSASGSGAATLAAALRAALVRQGLYEKEAAAMVKTWESTWLGDRGLRVLYTLPRAWTDRTLPLTIEPAPAAMERVMVGRAEIITPAMEQALLSKVFRYIAATAEERPKIVAETRELGMGRFTEAALRRLLMGPARSREFSSLSWELLQASTEPVK